MDVFISLLILIVTYRHRCRHVSACIEKEYVLAVVFKLKLKQTKNLIVICCKGKNHYYLSMLLKYS